MRHPIRYISLVVLTALGGVLLYQTFHWGWQKSWLNEQFQRCHALHGRGAYTDKLFECFENRPFTFKVEFNQPVEFKNPPPKKIYEARYEK